MKLGYHDVTVVSYTAGTNDNGKKLMDFVVRNPEGEEANVQLYFVSPENIRISLEQLNRLGWSKGCAKGLDAVIGGKGQIEVFEDTWLDNDGNERSNVKTRWCSAKPAVKTAMSAAAASAWIDGMADPSRKW
jgi:hypothetical protein